MSAGVARPKPPWPIALRVGFGVGVVLVVLGIAALFDVIIDERADALRQLDAQRANVETAASEMLRDELGRELATVDAQVAAQLAAPLSASDALLLVEDGVQILPPRSAPRETKAARTLAALTHAEALADDADHNQGLAERVALAHALPASYDAWLAHRRANVLRADLDLATTLFALERLDAAGALTPERAQALMRDGVSVAGDAVDGWLAALLRARGKLSASDFADLLARGVALGKRSLVRVDDVLALAAEPERVVTVPASDIAGHAGFLFDGGDGAWLAQGDAHRVVGRRVALDAIIAGIHDRLNLDGDVRLAPSAPLATATATALDRVTLHAQSQAWIAARTTIEQRFLVKVIPLGVVGALAVAVFALALLLQRRRAAYLELRSQLLAAVTHDLKTPLASIRALAETLALRGADHPGARDYPRRIVASSERLEFLVDNVLSFARLEREAWKPQLGPIAVGELSAWLGSWIGDSALTRSARPVDFTADVPPGLTLVGDADLVRLLLSNLVDNAAKYAVAERVAVRLVARRISDTGDAGGVQLAVSDDGPGLGTHDPKRLFEDFRRGHVEGVRGTGLGLSICRMVMALHGGTIAVAATSGRGTTFVATFPMHGERDRAARAITPALTR